MDSRFDITGKKIIFTGGSGGLGKGMTRGLLEAGAEVAVIDISDSVFTTVDEFRALGLNAHAVQGDIGTKASLEDCFNRALDALGGQIDVLFNVAGVQRRHPCEDFPYEDWQFVLNINLTGTFLLSQLAARKMIEQGRGGKIINIASMLSFFGGYLVPAYSASKGGVAQLTKALGNEWLRYGINVNALAPGYMDTAMNTRIIEDEKRNKEILERIPAGRWGTAEDMIGPSIFLASAASDYLSGAVVPVDGGYLTR